MCRIGKNECLGQHSRNMEEERTGVFRGYVGGVGRSLGEGKGPDLRCREQMHCCRSMDN